jgi:hypothetical protein
MRMPPFPFKGLTRWELLTLLLFLMPLVFLLGAYAGRWYR